MVFAGCTKRRNPLGAVKTPLWGVGAAPSLFEGCGAFYRTQLTLDGVYGFIGPQWFGGFFVIHPLPLLLRSTRR